jgi:hypothetical protein
VLTTPSPHIAKAPAWLRPTLASSGLFRSDDDAAWEKDIKGWDGDYPTLRARADEAGANVGLAARYALLMLVPDIREHFPFPLPRRSKDKRYLGRMHWWFHPPPKRLLRFVAELVITIHERLRVSASSYDQQMLATMRRALNDYCTELLSELPVGPLTERVFGACELFQYERSIYRPNGGGHLLGLEALLKESRVHPYWKVRADDEARRWLESNPHAARDYVIAVREAVSGQYPQGVLARQVEFIMDQQWDIEPSQAARLVWLLYRGPHPRPRLGDRLTRYVLTGPQAVTEPEAWRSDLYALMQWVAQLLKHPQYGPILPRII